MAPKNKSTWILEKEDSSFEEFNKLAAVLFPKREEDDKLLLHTDFSFAILSRYIRSVPITKTDGKTARKFVLWFRMYLQTKQSITQANTPTDRRFTLAEIEAKLRVSDLTECISPSLTGRQIQIRMQSFISYMAVRIRRFVSDLFEQDKRSD